MIEEPESLQAFQRKFGFLEVPSGIALLYIATSKSFCFSTELCLPLFALFCCASLIFHLSFQHTCSKKMPYSPDSNSLQMTIFFPCQAQHYYLWCHSPLKTFTSTGDTFFTLYPKGSRKSCSTLPSSQPAWE